MWIWAFRAREDRAHFGGARLRDGDLGTGLYINSKSLRFVFLPILLDMKTDPTLLCYRRLLMHIYLHYMYIYCQSCLCKLFSSFQLLATAALATSWREEIRITC
jgi:hypothetical protein